MLDSLLLGGVAALSLGCSDFLARFTSLRLGAVQAFTYVVVTGALLMTVLVVIARPELTFTTTGVSLAVIHGLCVTAMSIMLYAALARGPIGLAVPIVAAHPVLVLFHEFAAGTSQLSLQQALAAAIVVAGVISASLLEFHAGTEQHNAGAPPRGGKGGTVLLALGACVAYALLIIFGQSAAAEIGQIGAAWLGRLSSAGVLLLAAAAGLVRLAKPWPCARPLLAQGVLDTLGYVALLAGGLTLFPGITAVVASLFGFLTILLARFIIGEPVGRFQWVAIMVSFGGIAWLASGH